MDAADEAHRTARKRRLIVAEQRGSTSQCHGQFVAVDRSSEISGGSHGRGGVAEHCQNLSRAVCNRDDQRSVGGLGGVLNDLLDIR